MLNERQKKVHDFYISYIRENGRGPEMAEVRTELGLAGQRLSSVLSALIKKGYMKRISMGNYIPLVKEIDTDFSSQFKEIIYWLKEVAYWQKKLFAQNERVFGSLVDDSNKAIVAVDKI